MIVITKDLFAQQVSSQKVYYFSNPEELHGSTDSHYFVCISKTSDDVAFMVCCTSQFETVRKIIERNGYDHSTLASILKGTSSLLNKETHINCNQVFNKSIQWLYDKYKNGQLEYKGTLEAIHYEKILIGITKSDEVEGEIIEECERQLDEFNNLDTDDFPV